MRTFTLILLGLLPTAASLFAQQAVTAAPTPTAVRGVISTTQQRVDPTTTYHRVLAIVPLVGSGTSSDPVRPMFAPAPQGKATHTGIIAYQHQVSDDGTLSLVEFVAVDRSAFAALFASTDARVQYFEVGKSTQAQVQAAFLSKKASFSFATFQPLPVQ